MLIWHYLQQKLIPGKAGNDYLLQMLPHEMYKLKFIRRHLGTLHIELVSVMFSHLLIIWRGKKYKYKSFSESASYC